MAFREVTMIELREVLRQWLAGAKKKRIAAIVGMDPKTVRAYIAAAEASGLTPAAATELTDEVVGAITAQLRVAAGRPRGIGWADCARHRDRIRKYLDDDVRLTKVRKLLARDGIRVSYATLHRFAVTELGFGRSAPTIRVDDGPAGGEVQVDTGWVLRLTPDVDGKRRRVRAWIFTPSVSRYRFVFPTETETTASAIEACEAAWAFYGGIFAVIIPDNTKAIVVDPDALTPRITDGFLEYAQARGFVVDAARVGSPKDKARVERSVRVVRDDCFGGEDLATVADARAHAEAWCAEDNGMKRHTTTQRMPREHFEAVERAALLPAPTSPYDIPTWSEPKVARDQHAQVARALYSLPRRYLGKTLRARADRNTVRFYDRGTLIKAVVRLPPGGRATDPLDFPEEVRAYATRDSAFLIARARELGDSVGRYAEALLDSPLPWTRMRHVYALLRLGKKYGATRLDETCATALDVELVDIRRLERLLVAAAAPAPASARVVAAPAARFLRDPNEYALACVREVLTDEEGDPT
jgi:transposase